MKFFLAGIVHEANLFSPIPTTLESFKWQWWDPQDGPKPDHVDALAYSFALDEFKARGHSVAQSLFCSAQASGAVTASDWSTLKNRVLADLKNAGSVDAVFLFLHGAEVVDGLHDAEADIIEAVRAVVGPLTPIGVMLDLHTNMSNAKLDTGAYFVGCKEYPHVDYAARTRELVTLLERAAKGEIKPASTCAKINMTGVFPTTTAQMQAFLSQVQAHETGSILSISPLHGFFGAPGDQLGASVLVISDGDTARAARVAEALAQDFAVAVRGASGHVVALADVAAEISRWTAQSAGKPLVIADGADNPGGGAAGDSTFLLKALIETGASNAALGMVWDPMAVEIAHSVGEGARLDMRIGGKTSPFSGDPVDAAAVVTALRTDASQSLFGVGAKGQPLGRSACLRLESGLDVVVNSVRQQVFSPHCFTEHGINPAEKSIIVVKSSQHFEAGFAGLAGKIIRCDSPGSVAADYSVLPYTSLLRPIYPVDRDAPVSITFL